MAQSLDIIGQSLTCSSKKALKLFNEALTEYVLLRDNFYPTFAEALQLEDDSLVIVHSLLVWYGGLLAI